MEQGVYVSIAVYNRLGEKIGYDTLENDRQLCIKNMKAGEQYTIKISQYHEFGGYAINITKEELKS